MYSRLLAIFLMFSVAFAQKQLGRINDCVQGNSQFYMVDPTNVVQDKNWARNPLKLINFNDSFPVTITKNPDRISFSVEAANEDEDKPKPAIESALFGDDKLELESFELLWNEGENMLDSIGDEQTNVEVRYLFRNTDSQVRLILMAQTDGDDDEDILPFEEFMLERLGYWGTFIQVLIIVSSLVIRHRCGSVCRL